MSYLLSPLAHGLNAVSGPALDLLHDQSAYGYGDGYRLRRHRRSRDLSQGDIDYPALPADEHNKILHDVLETGIGLGQYLGETLDKPGRAVRGIVGGVTDLASGQAPKWGGGLLNLIPFSDAFGLTRASEGVSGGELLEKWGAVGPNRAGQLDWGSDVGGMFLEMALDPLNLVTLGGAAIGKAGKALKAAGLPYRGINKFKKVKDILAAAEPHHLPAFRKAIEAEGIPFDQSLEMQVGGLFGIPAMFKGYSHIPKAASGPTARKIAETIHAGRGYIGASPPMRLMSALFDYRNMGQVHPELQKVAQSQTGGLEAAQPQLLRLYTSAYHLQNTLLSELQQSYGREFGDMFSQGLFDRMMHRLTRMKLEGLPDDDAWQIIEQGFPYMVREGKKYRVPRKQITPTDKFSLLPEEAEDVINSVAGPNIYAQSGILQDNMRYLFGDHVIDEYGNIDANYVNSIIRSPVSDKAGAPTLGLFEKGLSAADQKRGVMSFTYNELKRRAAQARAALDESNAFLDSYREKRDKLFEGYRKANKLPSGSKLSIPAQYAATAGHLTPEMNDRAIALVKSGGLESLKRSVADLQTRMKEMDVIQESFDKSVETTVKETWEKKRLALAQDPLGRNFSTQRPPPEMIGKMADAWRPYIDFVDSYFNRFITMGGKAKELPASEFFRHLYRSPMAEHAKSLKSWAYRIFSPSFPGANPRSDPRRYLWTDVLDSIYADRDIATAVTKGRDAVLGVLNSKYSQFFRMAGKNKGALKDLFPKEDELNALLDSISDVQKAEWMPPIPDIADLPEGVPTPKPKPSVQDKEIKGAIAIATKLSDELVNKKRFVKNMQENFEHLYGTNMSDDMLNYGHGVMRSVFNLRGIHEALSDSINVPGAGYKLSDAFERIGLDKKQALKHFRKLYGNHFTGFDRVPEHIVSELASMTNKSHSPLWKRIITDSIGRFTQWFKENVTVPYPGFWNRNHIGGQTMNFLSGMITSPKDAARYAKRYFEAGNIAENPQAHQELITDVLATGLVKPNILQSVAEQTDDTYGFGGGLLSRGTVLTPNAPARIPSRPPLSVNPHLEFSLRYPSVAPTGSGSLVSPRAWASDARQAYGAGLSSPWELSGSGTAKEDLILGNPVSRAASKIPLIGGALDTSARAAGATWNFMRNFGTNVSIRIEWQNRVPMYLYLVKDKGWDAASAARYVNELQVDYSKLAPFERDYMSKLVPFYTFTRRTVPIMFRQLFERPGGATARAIRLSNISRAQGDYVPAYIGEGSSIPVPGVQNAYISQLGIPTDQFSELMSFGPTPRSTVMRTMQKLGAQTTPLLKALPEIGLGYNLYAGKTAEKLHRWPTDSILLNTLIGETPAGRMSTTIRNLRPVFGAGEPHDRSVPAAIGNFLGIRTHALPGGMQREVQIAQRRLMEEILREDPNIGQMVKPFVKPGQKLGDDTKKLWQVYREETRKLGLESRKRRADILNAVRFGQPIPY
jgi:hypothetical protein